MTDCACPAAGFCERYQRKMAKRPWEICQGINITPEKREAYVVNWRSLNGWSPYRIHPSESADVKGVGTILHDKLESLGIKPEGGCKCRQHTRRMDLEGPDWCEQHIDVIVGWLKEEAGNRSLPFAVMPAKMLVQWAIKEARLGTLDPTRKWRQKPLVGPVTRNLIFYVAPFSNYGGLVWKRNVHHLLARMDIFNGKRVVAIADSHSMDSAELVEREFRGEVTEFIRIPHQRRLREVAAFRPLFERIASTDPNTITFFAHSKAVTKEFNPGVTCHRWADVMYETCLDYLPFVEKTLNKFPLAGSFKKIGRMFTSSRSEWHYSGTFYWMRNAAVFRRNWIEIDEHWWGTESWPGLHFFPQEGGVLFWQGRGFSLYEMPPWESTFNPAYSRWQKAHAADYRTPKEVPPCWPNS